MMKQAFRCALAALLLFATLFALASCNGNPTESTPGETTQNNPSASVFNYMSSDLTKYFDAAKLKYTGATFDFATAYDKFLTNFEDENDREYKGENTYDLAYVEENWDTLRRRLQILHREGDGSMVSKSNPIGIGDEIYFYLVSAHTKNLESGELTPISIATEPFDTAYYDSPYGPFTVGEGEVYGAGFDLALLGKAPADTYLEKKTINELAATDVVYMKWSRVNKADSKDKTAAVTDRVDLSKWDAAVREALVAKFNSEGCPYGSEFTFEATVDGKTYTYTVTVGFVAEEKTITVEFKIPNNYYPVPDDKDAAGYETDLALSKLNTQTVVFELIIPYMIDYDVKDANTVEFYKDVVGFETDKTALNDVVEAYKAHTVKVMNEEVVKTVWNWQAQNIWGNLVNVENLFKDYPAAECEIQYDIVYNSLYSYWAANYSAYYTIDQYVNAAYGYQSADEYCYYATIGEAGQDLLMYYIYRENIKELEVPKAELDAAYEEYVKELIEDAEKNRADGDETVYDKLYFEEYYAENYKSDYLYRVATEGLIYKKVTDFLLAKNTVKLTGEAAEK